MSKIESGDFVMNRRNYDIAEQIINVLLNFEQKIEQKNIEIFLHLDKPCFDVLIADLVSL